MDRSTVTGATVATALLGAVIARSAFQAPPVRSVDATVLREYDGAYQWGPDAFLYLQLWSELAGTNQLVAFDESGEVRTLYSADRDRFFAGPGLASPASIESHVEFQRDGSGRITSLTWRRDGASPRVARRVEIERREDVRFASGAIQLAGTLISPNTDGKHPAIILVHASGRGRSRVPAPTGSLSIRHGIAVLGYDKRGVGGSTGDWNTASFDDLATDVVAAFEYLKTRGDIDRTQVGLLGWSQAGWIMPLAAVRAKELAFLISVSGAGVPAAETTIDQVQNEMTARGMRPEGVAQHGRAHETPVRIRANGPGVGRIRRGPGADRRPAGGKPPDTFPGTPDHPYWQFIRRLYFYDPAPTLRQLQVPTLALFGELDNNIMAEKNKAAWEAALKAGGNRDYTLRILPKANHLQLEAKVGSNAEMASLRRFVPVLHDRQGLARQAHPRLRSAHNRNRKGPVSNANTEARVIN